MRLYVPTHPSSLNLYRQNAKNKKHAENYKMFSGWLVGYVTGNLQHQLDLSNM